MGESSWLSGFLVNECLLACASSMSFSIYSICNVKFFLLKVACDLILFDLRIPIFDDLLSGVVAKGSIAFSAEALKFSYEISSLAFLRSSAMFWLS